MTVRGDIVQDFLIESFENLEELDGELLRLEKEPNSTDSLSAIFRTIHTIKGTSSFLGFSRLESLAHLGENLLSRLRDGKLTLTVETINVLLDTVDAIREMLAAIEATRSDGDNEYIELIDTLLQLQELDAEQSLRPANDETDRSQSVAPETSRDSNDVRTVTSEADRSSTHDVVCPSENRSTLDSPQGPAAAIRIDVHLLDQIMDLVGELVLTRNQIVLQSDAEKDSELATKYQRLNHITSDLQESVAKTRMQPVGRVWNMVPRLVRDVAAECGKQVRVELDGKETELDKSIIEAIKDPITHIVRNCVDHGLESPEERKVANKPLEGVVRLSARHESGQVVIEISDDGRGIDVASIREKAIQRELVTADVSAEMTESRWFDMIFRPGFSTAAKVTNISGRGVGLDVVKTNIETLGGAVELQSKSGEGTTFVIKIPLTLAIIPALIVSGGNSRYAVPQMNLTELVQSDSIEQDIETIYDTKVLRLRGDLLPLIRFGDVLGLGDARDEDAATRTWSNIVVVETGGRKFGLVVDGIHDTQEIVIKPLGSCLRSLPFYSGATILGDGEIALIIDVGGIAQRSGLSIDTNSDDISRGIDAETQLAQQTETWLIVGCSNQRKAISMSDVLRLEEFPRSSIEHSNGRPVIQYRGEILQLLDLDQNADWQEVDKPSTVHVVVITGRHSVGLVVEEIIDIMETPIGEAGESCGSIVVGKRITDVVSVPALLKEINVNRTPEVATQ